MKYKFVFIALLFIAASCNKEEQKYDLQPGQEDAIGIV